MRSSGWLIILLFLIASCSNESKDHAKCGKNYGGKFSFSEKSPVQTFHPPFASDETSARIAAQIFEGLVKWDPENLEIIPSLCENYSFNQNTFTYTFQLKKGIKFHDDPCFSNGIGKELTAKDVVYTFENICTKQLINAAYFNAFKGIVKGADAFFNKKIAHISGINAPDPYTVTIELIKPNDAFIRKLAGINYAIFAKEAYDAYGGKNKIGTGPFIPQNYDNYNDQLLLLKNKNYHGKDNYGNQLPFLDTIAVKFDKGVKQQITDVIAGKQSALIHLPASAIKRLISNNSELFDDVLKLQSSPLLSTYYIEFNLTDENLSNINFRKALNYGIDKAKLTEIIFGTSGSKMGDVGITPPHFLEYRTGRIKGYDFNPDSAKIYLIKAGFTDLNNLPSISLDISENDQKGISVSEELQLQLKQNLGIHLKVNIVPETYKLEKARYARGDLTISSYLAHYPSPESFLSMFYGKGVPSSIDVPSYPNTTRFKNAEFDKIMERGRLCVSEEEAFRSFANAERILMEEAPIIVLWYEEANALLDAKVQDFPLNKLMYIDLSKVFFGSPQIKNESLQEDPFLN